MLRDLTPPNDTYLRIFSDSNTLVAACVDYIFFQCMACGRMKNHIAILRPNKLKAEVDLYNKWLDEAPRCLCPRGGKP